ncbi:MAG: uroporphyrinogen decarboxylase [Spirochaetota bacterium]
MENHNNRFDRALRGLPVDRTPIWFMRQAGRYLPEYREVRKRLSFDEMLADADVSTEITLQPIRRFDLDAAVIFADIMTILNGLDIPFNFASGGPALDFHIHDPAETKKLSPERLLANKAKFAPFLAAIRQTRAALPAEKSVIGFAASPFTLLSYLIEGTTSKTHNTARAYMFSFAAEFHSLMASVAKCTIQYLKLQIEAGASAVQLFESWGDVLSPATYSDHILPHVREIVEAIQPLAPVILYEKGASIHMPVLRPFALSTGTILSVDWRISLTELTDLKVQGNLDPACLESDAASVRAETSRILRERAGQPGHVFNLGHGISPQAKLECVEAMVETVQQSKTH